MLQFKEVLAILGSNCELHAKFLNTLSLIEYRGARKIVKSQVDREITLELLDHIAEEIRHARVLKNLSLRINPAREFRSIENTNLSLGLTPRLNNDWNYQDQNLLGGSAGIAYIQSVDGAVAKSLPNELPWNLYLLTTLLLEERAAIVYPTYQEFLKDLGYPNSLSGIIRDEEKHLETVSDHLKGFQIEAREALLTDLRQAESRAFESFMVAILADRRSI